MLRHSFCHIPLISQRTERHLWQSGVESWDDGLAIRDRILDPARKASLLEELPRTVAAAQAGDLRYFAAGLPRGEEWRVFSAFRDRAVYLDIETTGMGGNDQITTIVAYDGKCLRHFIQGRNLQEFPSYIRGAEFLVTYNGKCFDVPFIQRQFGITVDAVHLDLRFILRSVGISGGLKRCEQQLGLDREGLRDVDGYFAVLLWQEFIRRRNERALETLLAYNALDVINLEPLMIVAHNRKVQQTPFAGRRDIPMPAERPANPFDPDLALIDRLRGSFVPFRRF